jgi:hypothetical protein
MRPASRTGAHSLPVNVEDPDGEALRAVIAGLKRADTHPVANVLINGVQRVFGHEGWLSVRAPKPREEEVSYRNCGARRACSPPPDEAIE